MAAPVITEAEFLGAIQGLLPPGRAWPRDSDTTLTKMLDGWARSYARVHARQANLLVDSFPSTTVELLPEWEATLGLPDPCAGPDPSLDTRQKHVVARLAFLGGQSVPYFIAFAAQLGFTITITEFSPFMCGMVCGLPIYGTDWAYAWQVNDTGIPVHYFLCGFDTAGNALAVWGNNVLLCELARLKPGHTVLIVNLISPPSNPPLVRSPQQRAIEISWADDKSRLPQRGHRRIPT